MPASDTSGDNLTRRTLSGLKWAYLQTAISAILQLVVAAVLARLLGPEAFGLVALGDLALRFINYFARAGVVQAVIQKPDLSRLDIRAAFTSSVVLGAVFSGVVWLAAPIGGIVFNDPDVVPVLRWMGVSLALYGAGATADALLRRELRFQALAVRDIASYVVGYPVVGLSMAAAGFGVWSLVAATLTQTGLKSLLAYLAYRHDVRPTGHLPSYRAILGFGGQVSVISFLEFLGYELDTFAVGRYAGTAALGLYNRAYLIIRLPVYHITTSFSKVVFPAFSSVQQEAARFRGAYVSAVSIIAAVVLPTAAGMAVAGAELVAVVLGPQWTGAVPVLPWIALASAVTMVTHVGAVSLEARGLLRGKLAVSAGRVVVLAALLTLAVDGPLWMYGAALAGAQLFSHAAYLVLVSRMLEMSSAAIFRTYTPALFAAGTVAGGVGLVRWAMVLAGAPDALTLVAQAITGAILLVLQLRFGPMRTVRDDLFLRLRNAGALSDDGTGRLGRSLRLLLGSPRRTSSPPSEPVAP